MSPDALAVMKRHLLGELARRVVTIPAGWRSVQVYDALVMDGTAALVVNVSPMMRGYTITQAGRDFLKELNREASNK